MAKSYDISDKIKSAFATKLIADFDIHAVSDLETRPVITKTITNKTPEPYIYINDAGSIESWVTKDSEARDYSIMIEIVVKHRTNRGTHKQREQISNEVLNILATDTDDYPDLSADGFKILQITTADVVKLDFVEKGARYYKAVIPFSVIAAIDEEAAGDENPVQALSYTYSGFSHTPVNNNVEFYDSGTVTFATSYPSDNNGWDFDEVTYTLTTNDGSLTNNVLSIDGTDPQVTVRGDIDYELDSDSSRTYRLSPTATFNRIVSFRYGIIAADGGSRPTFTDDTADTYGLRNFSNWEDDDDNKVTDYGTVNPNNEEITFKGVSGDYMYIITDKDVSDISALTHVTVVSNNIISQFEDPVTTGEYKVYITTNPLYFDGDITVTVTV